MKNLSIKLLSLVFILIGHNALAKTDISIALECTLGGITSETNRIFLQSDKSGKVFAYVQEKLTFEQMSSQQMDVDFKMLKKRDLLICPDINGELNYPISCGTDKTRLEVSIKKVSIYNFVIAKFKGQQLGECNHLDLKPGL